MKTSTQGQPILRYLIAQPKCRETVDILTAALCPEVAERKLRIAISALHCSLNGDFVSEPSSGYILCKGQAYQLNPSVQLHSDVDEFLALYQAGQKASDSETRASYFEKACQLYSGPFLLEDIYADWSYFRREEFMKTYVIMCDKLAEYNLQSQCYEAAAKWGIGDPSSGSLRGRHTGNLSRPMLPRDAAARHYGNFNSASVYSTRNWA